MDTIRDNRLEQVSLRIIAEKPEMRHLFTADMFSTIQHIFIFEKITKAHEDGAALDANLLVGYLDSAGRLGEVGTELVSKIFSLDYSDEYIVEYSKKLARLSLLRKSQAGLFTIADRIGRYDIPELVSAVDGIRQLIFDEIDITDEDYSFEMSNAPMIRRVMSMESGIPTHRLQRGLVSEEEKTLLRKLATQLKPIPLSFRYAVGQNISELSNLIRLSAKVNGTKIFAIDYVQQMEVTSGNETQDLNKIAKDLKNIAVELDVVVLLLSQLNRNLESRKNKKPLLSDLRQAGGLEESSDKVIFPYREYYYSKDPGDMMLAELLVAKNRNGPIADFNVLFNEEITNFYS